MNKAGTNLDDWSTSKSISSGGSAGVFTHSDMPTQSCEFLMGAPMVACSSALRQLLRLARRVAGSELAVLIAGESGSGKELLARAVHQYSLRSARPWIDVNCGALPGHLMESELFGYERGAFSGADRSKPGLFELADGGTLFLDEVGELGPEAQVKLLRVLDGAPYFRLGGTRKVTTDVRIVAATNQDLQAAVAAGKFRLDLFHRLAQVVLTVPPLRTRPEDILPLANFFLQQQAADVHLTDEAICLLQHYSWPGNVRELRNVVRRAALLSEGGVIEASHLALGMESEPSTGARLEFGPQVSSAASDPEPAPDSYCLATIERATILAAMERAGGQQQRAANLLGISAKTLGRKLKSYGRGEKRGELRVMPRSDGSERRQQPRKAVSGSAVLCPELPMGSQFVVTLRDVSSSGFRAAHENRGLRPGQELSTDGALGHSRARVIWTRVVGNHLESGFAFVSGGGRTLT